MKKYELTVLVHPDMESEIDKAIETVTNIITKADGKVIKQDNWGKKRLAYSIDKQFFANYLYFELELPADAPLKISNVLNITKEVLRYLLVKADEKTDSRVETTTDKE
ncbi:MAG: 30S ribosomal protein S6 [Candidatus Saccharibacteria bacterium]|nr:30S ribosomal protein S6 [Candidatus Saccharibacteria bacterium]